MNRESQLLDLVVQWEELRAEGKAVDLADLCCECPELLDELRQNIQAVSGVDALLRDGTAPIATGLLPTMDAANIHLLGRPTETGGDDRWTRAALPDYEILEELGRGGMGLVYKARQVSLGRTVALKTLLPRRALPAQARRRFLQEAKIMALLQHPNVVQIYEIIDRDHDPLLVMEYVSGGDLADKLAGQPLPPRVAAELAAVLARTVQAAHQLGVVHRDLKPTNVLLTAEGKPKICDFGVAKWCDSPHDGTQTGQLLGTPSYMAPEQLELTRTNVGPAVDVYALGAILYELLIGHPPFVAANAFDTFRMVTTQEPVAPRHLKPKTPCDLNTICLKCLEKNPQRRYPTAQALAEELERYLAGQPICARPLGPGERLWRWGCRHPIMAALLSASLAAVALVLVLVISFNRRVTEELQRTSREHDKVVVAQEALHHTLIREVANRLNGDLRELATVPLTLAALLEHGTNWEEPGLRSTMQAVLDKSPLVFGLCVAYEPRAWRDDQEDFAIYLFRSPAGLTTKLLVPPGYQPHYRQWAWYRAGRDSAQGSWGEPYVGVGANGTPMITFSAPLHRDGKFVGVVTADLAMAYFDDLRNSLDRLDLGADSCCFVVTNGNRILVHPDERFEYPAATSALETLPLDGTMRHLVNQWHSMESGTGCGVDFVSGRIGRFFFVRVPTADWTVVLASFDAEPPVHDE